MPAPPPSLEQDGDYVAAGASLGSAAEAFGQDVVLKIRQPGGCAVWGEELAGGHAICKCYCPAGSQ